MAGGYLSLRERMVSTLLFKRSNVEDFWAINDVSFQVNPGEALGIIGRNGAGKSTLLKVLSKITRPTQGKFITRGRIASLLEVGTGFHPELSGRENIFFNGSLLGMKRREIESKFDEIVDFSGAEKFLDTALKHYSSGMQLRLAFSVAAFLEPEILIIDEVLAVGDAEFQKKCIGKMEDVIHGGKTMLFVSHNMSAVSTLCNKCILLDSGKIISSGEPNKVIEHYTSLESSRISSTSAEVALPNGVYIRNLEIELCKQSTHCNLVFSFTISSDFLNPISGLALLIYNELNERVGILDLRANNLYEVSTQKNEISVKGVLKSMPLIEGNYFVGLNIVSNSFQGDYYKLTRFEVLPISREIIPFDKKYRGYVDFEYEFEIK
jgi:lipopolysaccharide transport system ATP-binding protein